MDIDTVADELYSLPPDEFIAARNAHEKEARSAGDRALAADIHRLGKPSLAAWLANQLSRQRAADIGPLLDLGAGLREATATLSGRQLLELGRQQHKLVYALVQQARGLAADAGRTVGDAAARGLEDTLQAALADEAAADQLRAGRLTEVLQRTGSGFPPTAGTPEPPVAGRSALGSTAAQRAKRAERAAQAERAEQAEREERAKQQERAELAEQTRREGRRRAAERVEEEARATVRDTAVARDRAHAAAAEATQAVRDAAAAVERLREELNAATDEHARRLEDEQRLQAERDAADVAADEARRRLDEAVERLADL